MKRARGFTIVELLIVIVVIAILASITIVAFNGVQQRANNAKTQQAFASWIKALTLYKNDNGKWPQWYSCLGEGYLYGPTGADTTGTAQCRQTTAPNSGVELPAFKSAMQPYFSGRFPAPAFVTAYSSDTNWYRGMTYVYGGGTNADLVYIQAVLQGTGACPSIAGQTASSTTVMGGNSVCFYQIGTINDT